MGKAVDFLLAFFHQPTVVNCRDCQAPFSPPNGEELVALGWKWGKAPAKFAPGKMAAMGVYQNRNGHLPPKSGRIWYEADIHYDSGRRNGHRLLWSNDGLLFVTYDHYGTFLEII